MRYFIFTLILSTLCCVSVSNSACHNSKDIEPCDTIVKTHHIRGGEFTPEDVEDTPPRYVTIDVGEIVDTAWFSMLKGILDTTRNTTYYNRVNDVLLVDVFICDWEMVKRWEEFRKQEDPWKNMWTLSRDILTPVTAINERKDDYLILTKSWDLWNIEGIDDYALIMVDSIPTVLPKRFEGELYKTHSKVTYKYTSNYMKYAGDPITILSKGHGIYYNVKNGKIEKMSWGSVFMGILIE